MISTIRLVRGTYVKPCCDCQKAKPLDQYHKNKNRAGGVNGVCKPCMRVRATDYLSRNRESCNRRSREWKRGGGESYAKQAREYAAQWKLKNPEKHRANYLKTKSVKNYGEFWEAHRAFLETQKQLKKEGFT